jgi:hypothetical protein
LKRFVFLKRDPGGIQTHDRLLRRQELYSTELPGRATPPGRAARRKTAAKIIKIRQEAKQRFYDVATGI